MNSGTIQWSRVRIGVLVVCLLATACSGGSSDAGESADASGPAGSPNSSVTLASELDAGQATTLSTTTVSDATQPPTVETPTTPPPETSAPAPTIPNDRESGLRFDVGQIKGVREVQGATILEFDRFQAYDATSDSFISGTELQTEYIVAAITDWPFINENPQLRDYPVAPSVMIVITSDAWMQGQGEFCGGDGSQDGEAVVYVPAALATGLDGLLASLTFDENGWVSNIRFMQTC